MSLRPRGRLIVPPDSQRILEERALQLASETAQSRAEEAEESAFLRFYLQGAAYVLELGHVHQVVTKLGKVEQIAGAPGAVRGIAFIDNLPHAVVELGPTVGGAPRPLDVIASGPAVVLGGGEGTLALSVDGPVEMVEVAGVPLDHSRGGELGERLEIAGRLLDGTLVISNAWLEAFRERALGARA